jgi:hypothetical protein
VTEPTPPRRHRHLRRAVIFLGVIVSATAVLATPDCEREPPTGAGRSAFAWNQDTLWRELESRFERARALGCQAVTPALDVEAAALRSSLAAIPDDVRSDDSRLDQLERAFFDLAPQYGACPARTMELVALASELRTRVKHWSQRWPIEERSVRNRLYRLLYGARAASEELLLQASATDVEALTPGTMEPSSAPSIDIRGVTVHSGDILLSRGGAPTSALIARGNDYPGNFSHVALLHVSENGVASIIESHIEVGVVVSTIEQYLADTKLRILVLRLAADRPEHSANPQLAHRAATDALTEARTRHIPYDFAMRYDDPSTQFCSEVASAAYARQDVILWEGLTSMSSPGVVAWLGSFGVEQFETHGPSDLEYDPKLVVVAEWRDPETLFADHVDNAIVDAMLEGAERGEPVGHDPWLLPLARLAKAYSVLLNWFGAAGPVPEGMSATVALRAEHLAKRHAAIATNVHAAARDYERRRGYRPPYWELVRLAREARRAIGDGGM